jgi:hypothetical protein
MRILLQLSGSVFIGLPAGSTNFHVESEAEKQNLN